MAVDLRQDELRAWAEKNFGEDKLLDSDGNCIAMMEELGELAHILTKRRQGIRNIDGDKARDLIGDAFADIVIYGIQLMECEELDAEMIIGRVIAEVLERDWKKDPVKGVVATEHKGHDG